MCLISLNCPRELRSRLPIIRRLCESKPCWTASGPRQEGGAVTFIKSLQVTEAVVTQRLFDLGRRVKSCYPLLMSRKQRSGSVGLSATFTRWHSLSLLWTRLGTEDTGTLSPQDESPSACLSPVSVQAANEGEATTPQLTARRSVLLLPGK